MELPWRDAEGNPETSVVLAHTGAASKAGTKKPTPAAMAMALESFFEAGNGKPVHVEAWRDPFYRMHTGDTADAKKKAFLRVRRELVDMGAMTARDDIYAIGPAEPWKDWHGKVAGTEPEMEPNRCRAIAGQCGPRPDMARA